MAPAHQLSAAFRLHATMSALGQKLPRLTQSGVSALPPKAAADVTDRRVRFGPKAAVSRCSNARAIRSPYRQ